MSFTLKCNNCGNKERLKDGEDYSDPLINKTKSISLTFGPVTDEGAEIACGKCGKEIKINKY